MSASFTYCNIYLAIYGAKLLEYRGKAFELTTSCPITSTWTTEPEAFTFISMGISEVLTIFRLRVERLEQIVKLNKELLGFLFEKLSKTALIMIQIDMYKYEYVHIDLCIDMCS